MIDIFKGQGCKLRKVGKKQGASGGFLESSIMLIQDRLSTGRLKVLESCPQLLEEMRRFHRDEDGKIVGYADDLIAGLRYALTGLKYAKTEVESRGNVSNDNVTEVNFFGQRRAV